MQRGGIYLFLFIIFFITNVGKGFAVTNMESSFHFENIDYQTNSNTEEGLSFHNYHFLSFNLIKNGRMAFRSQIHSKMIQNISD